MDRHLARKIRWIRARLLWVALCRRLLWVTAWVALALALLVLAGKLFILPIGLREVAPWAIGAGAVWLAAWMAWRRMSLMDAAKATDARLALKERISTAFAIGQPRNEPEALVIEDAAHAAYAIRARRAFPLRAGRPMGWSALALAALAALWCLPQYNLLAKQEKEKQQQAVAIKANQKEVKKLEELAAALGEAQKIERTGEARKIQEGLAKLAKQIEEQKISQEEALARLNQLSEKMKQRQSELQDKLEPFNSMAQKGEGRMTGPVEKAMKQGDFEKAAKAMQSLQDKLQKGELTQQEKEALAKELEMMAKKMGENTPMAQQMAKAAEDLKQGQDANALAKLEMTADQLMDMQAALAELQSLDAMQYDMEGRSRAMSGQPVLGKAGEGESGEGDEGDGQMNVSPWEPGDSREQGLGMGRSGIGQGAVAQKNPGQVGFVDKRIKGQITPGEIIARMKVPGEQGSGEVTAQYEDLRVEFAQRAEDTIRNERLPLEHKVLIRDYFDAIKSGEEKQ